MLETDLILDYVSLIFQKHSPGEMFFKKSVLKILVKFIGKYLQQSLFILQLIVIAWVVLRKSTRTSFFSNYGTVFDFMLKPKILGGMF